MSSSVSGAMDQGSRETGKGPGGLSSLVDPGGVEELREDGVGDGSLAMSLEQERLVVDQHARERLQEPVQGYVLPDVGALLECRAEILDEVGKAVGVRGVLPDEAVAGSMSSSVM